jgi:hypothetical protein
MECHLNNYYLKSSTSKLHFIHSSRICRKKLWPFSRKHFLNLEFLISILQKEIVAFFKKALFESGVSDIYTPSLVYCAFYKPLYKIHLLFNNFHIMYCLNICIMAQDIMALHHSIASIQQLGSLHILNLVRFLKQSQSKVENQKFLCKLTSNKKHKLNK